jgi:ABC-type glycerol-3-phosphate transport system substrate-binding protein
MGDMRPFQIILIATFLLLGLVGIAFFALYSGVLKNENPYGAQVVIWGTLDDEPLITALAMLRENDKNASVISYVQKDARTFETELVNALAESRGPDLIILPHDLLISYRAKIAPLTFDAYPVRTFKDSYIDGAEIFMLKDGIYALPIAVDPLLMYWNKDIFSTKGLATPPATWEEMVNVTVPRIVERDFSYNVTRAALAFGQYVNVRNAKNILSLLFMQAGSVMAVDSEERLFVELDRSATMQGLPPAQAGLTFFTQFSNPVSQTYTWNRALPEDRNEFLAGDLALYFGLASEVNEIRNGNPNLNFDAAEVPQGKGVAKRQGYGIFYGMARIKNSTIDN